jgi:hypothetical protein
MSEARLSQLGLAVGYSPTVVKRLTASSWRWLPGGTALTFVGKREGPASQFRWKLYGLPGWTCFGDGSGFPAHGEAGDCSNGAADVEWYHA